MAGCSTTLVPRWRSTAARLWSAQMVPLSAATPPRVRSMFSPSRTALGRRRRNSQPMMAPPTITSASQSRSKASTILVGSPRAAIGGNAGQGALYVFTESNGTWSQTQKLTASDGATNDSFGESVALDGSTALIGRTMRLSTAINGRARPTSLLNRTEVGARDKS